MKFYITDESNITKDDKFEFFVYGGLIIDELEIRKLSEKLLELKSNFNIAKERPIKWPNVNWNKQGELDSDVNKKIKEKILGAVSLSGCRILIYLAPHDFYHEYKIKIANLTDIKISSYIDPKKYIKAQTYALNVCSQKFNKFLESINEVGMILADNFENSNPKEIIKHCSSLYTDGVKYSSGVNTSLDRIVVPILQVNNEYSHIHQVNDVVIGAITYSMREMSENFLPIIKNNFWAGKFGDSNTIINYGINIYPKSTTTLEMTDKIKKIENKFKRLLI